MADLEEDKVPGGVRRVVGRGRAEKQLQRWINSSRNSCHFPIQSSYDPI